MNIAPARRVACTTSPSRRLSAAPTTSIATELDLAILRVKAACRNAHRASSGDAAIAPADAAEVYASFAALEPLLCAAFAELDADAAAARGAQLQTDFLPYLLMSHIGERWYAKPRGYAGDYLSIAQMYDDQPSGHGRLGAILDRCFRDVAASVAVRNRRALVAREILDTVGATQDRAARVTSLACGPAAEVFDTYEQLEDPSRLTTTLLDNDLQALAYVADRRDAKGLRRRIELVQENLVYVASGRRSLPLDPQDLVYSIGLIDYFNDRFVVRLLDWIHSVLRPGGRVILGNFHPDNPTKPFMDHILDWKLIHRGEEDMHRLFKASAFGRACTRILFEPQRINLFAECVKTA